MKIITPSGRYASQGRSMRLGQSAVKDSYSPRSDWRIYQNTFVFFKSAKTISNVVRVSS